MGSAATGGVDVRAGIPTHSLARFEAERDAQARRDRRWERLAVAGLTATAILFLAFWAAVAYVVMHFVLKAW
jgi:hypothetical protein